MMKVSVILLLSVAHVALAGIHNVMLWQCDDTAASQGWEDNTCLTHNQKCVHLRQDGGMFLLEGPSSYQLTHKADSQQISDPSNKYCLQAPSADGVLSLTVEECNGKKEQQWVRSGRNVQPSTLPGLCLDATQTPCDNAPFNTYKYCNDSLDLVERVTDLMERMQVAEKISQLGTGAKSIDRLQIPAYQWWSEGLHGVAGSPGVHFGAPTPYATSFPQVINLGATFNKTMVKVMGGVISTEARAFANVGHAGLTYFAPNINIYRDPRWGRGQETPGEDPFLTSEYAKNFVNGMQFGYDTRYFKVVATCKHYAAYDLENWNHVDRFHFNANVSDQDFVESYFPAFQACSPLAGSIMCSYNAVNGVPSCANNFIMNEMARGQFGFRGYMVSDCGAIQRIMSAHQYTKTPEDTVAAGLHGGCDLDCGGFYPGNTQTALDKKTITEGDLDYAVGRLFGFRMILGMFDPVAEQPYEHIGVEQVNTAEHQALALEAARESMVLLKNTEGVLPMKAATTTTVAVIGPNSAATGTMQGNYHGTAPYLVSPQEGLQKAGVQVTQVQGCDVKCTDTSKFEDATKAAAASDFVVLVVGLDQGQESEGHDRTNISLPGNQNTLVAAVAAAAKGPVVLVVMTGGPVDLTYAKANSKIPAIIWCGYPGQSGGQAIADVIFGVYNPGGRLPYTIYPDAYVNQISMFDMSFRSSPGRTYKFFTGEAAYGFGDGLSYTTFSYEWTETLGASSLSTDELKDGVHYRVTVTNTGKILGDDSVLAYITSSVPGAPMKQLFGFERVKLEPGKSASLFFAAPAETFTAVNGKGERHIHPATYTISIGSLRHTITTHGDAVHVPMEAKEPHPLLKNFH
ncbi:uncharacterized protein LOC135814545 isoform X1 [Sycon ciliatum]|uniref:uncharacterized protein LOC135814545 isoform X1 n=1 Tax=Sycon ciliatum TaxID=27933 RepID=UPI0020AE7CA6|eukprot:scpid37380/ scgid14181/ Probable beta-D-xylosidase 2